MFTVCLTIAELYCRSREKYFSELLYWYSPDDPEIKEKVDWLSLEVAKERNAAPEILELYQNNPIPYTYGHPRFEIEDIEKNLPLDIPQNEHQIMQVWNRNFIQSLYCDNNQWYFTDEIFGLSTTYIFEPFDSTPYPIYRFFPNSSNDRNLLRFNSFGWGGDDIAFIKPDKTIRIAFIGASTTQQISLCQFAYPDYIGSWLNKWAELKGLDIRFEVINTARSGHKSPDFSAIFKYELMPVEPDVTIFYEGRNQFDLHDRTCACKSDQGNFLYALLSKSMLLRKLVALTNYNILKDVEDLKPADFLDLPTVNISHPDINSPYLPLNLSSIFMDIDSIKNLGEKIDNSLVISSYAMLTNKEILSHGLKYGSVYSYWMNNLGSVRLNDIAILNGYQNRALKLYCEKNNLQFIDVAKNLTRLPEAFIDGIHLNCPAMKYHAWLVFLDLLPVIEEKINAGLLPRKSTQTLSYHPYIRQDEVFQKISIPFTNCD